MDERNSTVTNDNSEEPITSLVQREVYSLSGLYVGDVHDVRLDFETLEISHLVIEDINSDVFTLQNGKDGILIPYKWVRAVGDVILINDIGPSKAQQKASRAKARADD